MVNWHPLGTIWHPFEGAGKMNFLLGFGLFSGAFAVSFREGKPHSPIYCISLVCPCKHLLILYAEIMAGPLLSQRSHPFVQCWWQVVKQKDLTPPQKKQTKKSLQKGPSQKEIPLPIMDFSVFFFGLRKFRLFRFKLFGLTGFLSRRPFYGWKFQPPEGSFRCHIGVGSGEKTVSIWV